LLLNLPVLSVYTLSLSLFFFLSLVEGLLSLAGVYPESLLFLFPLFYALTSVCLSDLTRRLKDCAPTPISALLKVKRLALLLVP
jgi:hypothetical protein